MNKQVFLDKYMEYNRSENTFRIRFTKDFKMDKLAAEDMDEGQFKEIVFFNLRKMRQEFVQDIDRLTQKIARGLYG